MKTTFLNGESPTLWIREKTIIPKNSETKHGRRKEFEVVGGGGGGLTFSNFSDTFFCLRKIVISQTLGKSSMAAITINWLYIYTALNPRILNFV